MHIIIPISSMVFDPHHYDLETAQGQTFQPNDPSQRGLLLETDMSDETIKQLTQAKKLLRNDDSMERSYVQLDKPMRITFPQGVTLEGRPYLDMSTVLLKHDMTALMHAIDNKPIMVLLPIR